MKRFRILMLTSLLLLLLTLSPVTALAAADGPAALTLGADAITTGATVCLGTDGRAPVLWQVISDRTNLGGEDGRLLLSAEVLGGTMYWVDAMQYAEDACERFFTAGEQAAVLTVSTEPSRFISHNDFHWTEEGLTNARTFLLSAEEADVYFASDTERLPGLWWLRSYFGTHHDYAGMIGFSGFLTRNNINYGSGFGPRPAFNLDVSAVAFTSDASADAALSAAFTPVTEGDASVLKLTLLDAARGDFTAAVSEAARRVPTGYARWLLAVSYADAPIGKNEAVAALLCDSTGKPLYRAATESAGTGRWTLALPAGLSAGDYTLYLYSARQNGAYQTDYASPLVSLPLTVG